MYLASVVYLSITVVFGKTHAGEESKVTVQYSEPDKGNIYRFSIIYNEPELISTKSYYDGDSLRDEKWRFDPKTGSTVVSRRNGFRDKDSFHLVDATLDALGSFTKSYRMKNEKDLIRERVKEPQMNKERENIMNESIKGTSSNAFSGVTFNTQYSTQNGYPHVPNVMGIQNNPNLFHTLNFQQAFSGFGFQQLFNQQSQFPSNPVSTSPNNQHFQLPNFLMPNNIPNQYQPFGTGSLSVAVGQGMGPEQQNAVSSTVEGTDVLSTLEPIIDITTTTTSTTTTTPDPTLNFDIRLEKDKNMGTNVNVTQSIQTTSRRPIEGLPTSDEDDADDGGVLDDKIKTEVLKTLVG